MQSLKEGPKTFKALFEEFERRKTNLPSVLEQLNKKYNLALKKEQYENGLVFGLLCTRPNKRSLQNPGGNKLRSMVESSGAQRVVRTLTQILISVSLGHLITGTGIAAYATKAATGYVANAAVNAAYSSANKDGLITKIKNMGLDMTVGQYDTGGLQLPTGEVVFPLWLNPKPGTEAHKLAFNAYGEGDVDIVKHLTQFNDSKLDPGIIDQMKNAITSVDTVDTVVNTGVFLLGIAGGSLFVDNTGGSEGAGQDIANAFAEEMRKNPVSPAT
jgi:hypothetical protein